MSKYKCTQTVEGHDILLILLRTNNSGHKFDWKYVRDLDLRNPENTREFVEP